MNTEIVNTRTGVGVGIGAAVGFLFGGPMGAGVGALLGGGIANVTESPSKGVMTAKRKLIYTRAMETIKDPTELVKLADAFESEGLPVEGGMLRKRAKLRDLPQDTREKRRVWFRKAMASDNPDVIAQVAIAFENEGAIDAAKSLKDHATAVRAAHAAGKSAKPLTGGSQAQFADKLAKAIIHFGPSSVQALEAAKNLIQARGKTPSNALAAEVVRVAANALKVAAPDADGDPPKSINIDATAAGAAGNGVDESVAPETVEETSSAPPLVDTGAREPAVVGHAAAPVEPPAIPPGVAPENTVSAADAEPPPELVAVDTSTGDSPETEEGT
ncbi:MAG TPA: hypothetical protein VII66_03280 [Gemmatimonadaceae bacterium]